MLLKGKQALAYTGGIIDGEGCISISRRKRNPSLYELIVSVWNTNEWLCQWLKMNYGGSVTFLKKRKPRRAIWKWAVSHNKAEDFLKLILPYLQLKAPEAEVAIAFQEKRRQSPRTPELLVIMEAERILLSKMKQPHEQ